MPKLVVSLGALPEEVARISDVTGYYHSVKKLNYWQLFFARMRKVIYEFPSTFEQFISLLRNADNELRQFLLHVPTHLDPLIKHWKSYAKSCVSRLSYTQNVRPNCEHFYLCGRNEITFKSHFFSLLKERSLPDDVQSQLGSLESQTWAKVIIKIERSAQKSRQI